MEELVFDAHALILVGFLILSILRLYTTFSLVIRETLTLSSLLVHALTELTLKKLLSAVTTLSPAKTTQAAPTTFTSTTSLIIVLIARKTTVPSVMIVDDVLVLHILYDNWGLREQHRVVTDAERVVNLGFLLILHGFDDHF